MSGAWTNRNKTQMFKKTIGTDWVALHDPATGGVECSNVTIQAYEGTSVSVAISYDGQDADVSTQYWVVPASDVADTLPPTTTFRGITNSDQVSAKATSSSTKIQFITSFYDGQILTG